MTQLVRNVVHSLLYNNVAGVMAHDFDRDFTLHTIPNYTCSKHYFVHGTYSYSESTAMTNSHQLKATFTECSFSRATKLHYVKYMRV